MSRIERPTDWDGRDRPMLWLAGALVAAALAGVLHVVFGEWRPGPGGKPWVGPLVAYLVIAPAAMLVARRAHRRAPPADAADEPPVGALPVLMIALWAVAFFVAVRTAGIATGTFLSMLVAMLALSARPWEAARRVVPIALAVAAAFWLTFTRLVPIVLGEIWLF